MFKLFQAPQPEPGNLESIMSHAQESAQACEYDFRPKDATELAHNIADIHMGERLNKFSDTEREIYESTWCYTYYTKGKGSTH